MSAFSTPFRRLLLRLAPMLGLVLTIGLLAIATHQHHDDTPRHHHCAVCSANQTTAFEPRTLVEPPILRSGGERIAIQAIEVPLSVVEPTRRDRAPPIS